MKLELLVMAGQHTAVNMSLFLALTARQTMGVEALSEDPFAGLGGNQWLGLSRNKVSLPEGGDGPPP